MNIRDESSSPSSHLLNDSKQFPNATLRPEEIRAFKDCVHESYFKAGIPFAILCKYVSYAFGKKEKMEFTTKALLRSGITFIGNVFIGTMIFLPVCYKKISIMRAEFEEKNKNLQDQQILKLEGTQPEIQAEDFSYPADLITNLNEPEASFSSDFSTSKLLLDEAEKLSTPSTTYDELRAKHRNTYAKNEGYQNLKPQLGTYSTPVEKPVPREPQPSQRTVKKNKYGDEIE